MQRRRIKQAMPLKGRSAQLAEEARERAMLLPPGKAREDLLRLVRQSENASHVAKRFAATAKTRWRRDRNVWSVQRVGQE
jgi:hypothetical protein